MNITHLAHACVLIETGDARLLIDPGTLSNDYQGLRDLDAILVTHEHDDHVDFAQLPALAAANPSAKLLVDTVSRERIQAIDAERIVTVVPGDVVMIGDVKVQAVGGHHTPVYADVPGCPNLGYLIDDGRFFHPGDSFHIPEQRVDVLALPTSGPWLKLGDAIEYFRAVRPRIAVPIHEGALASIDTHYHLLGLFAPDGSDFRPLEHGQPAEL